MGIPASELEAGVDYPRNRLEFEEFFPDEGSCLAYLERVRWPDGFDCPRCGAVGPPWRSARGLLACRKCPGQVSVLSGGGIHLTDVGPEPSPWTVCGGPLEAWWLAAPPWGKGRYSPGPAALNQVVVAYRCVRDSELKDSVEDHPATAGPPPVETKDELVQIAGQVRAIR